MVAKSNSPEADKTTFLFCAESGWFEAITVLAVESLRRFGGALADSPVLVVTPRLGPPLSRATLKRFDELSVRYIYKNYSSPCAWYPYTNKAYAALMADEFCTTEQVTWLDSDVVIAKEPRTLLLSEGEDFCCCAFDKNVGSAGPEDPYDAFWRAMGEVYGYPVEQLPWVTTELEKQRIRFRLHSGVYTFRRGKGLGAAFVRDIETMLSSKVAFSKSMPFPGDDVALAYSVLKGKLGWRLLPILCNYYAGMYSPSYRREDLPNVEVIHYHHALSRDNELSWLLQELDAALPEMASWLRERTPIARGGGALAKKLARRFLHELRNWQSTRVAAQCRNMVAG